MLLLFLCWFFIVDVVRGAPGGLENCRETHCKHNGPAIRFPFRVKDRQPIHCGYEGFDLSCTNDNQTVLEIPSSAYNKLFVKTIDYKFQEIEIYDPNGCLLKQLLNLSLSSSPFESIYGDDNYTTFSCPSSIQRDQLNYTWSWCMVKLSPCLGNNPAENQIFAVSGSIDCSMDSLPLVSCTKVRDYTSVPVMEPDFDLIKLHWSIPSCEYCEMMKKKCRPRTNYRYYPQKNEIECYAPKDVVRGAPGGLENCRETHCKHNGPAIRFPFRVKDRQPIHCGYEGFDLSCTNDNQTVLEIPSSAYNKLFVKTIDYKFQEIEIYDPNGCLLKQLLNLSLSSSPFESIYGDDNYTTFSCPSSIQRDQLNYTWSWCMVKLSPCLGNNPAENQIFAVSGWTGCSMDSLPLVSCTKVRDYTSVPVMEPDFDLIKLHWSIPSCEYCEMMKKKCRPRTNYRYYPQKNEIECYAPKGIHLGRPGLEALGISALSVVVIATGIVLYHVYSSNNIEKENQLKIERFLDDYRAQKPSRYSYSDIKRITNQFKEKLGQGAYGTVFKGTLSTELLVAVKILNNSNEKGEDFINEVGTMGRIHHVNVVRMVGFCADGYIRALVYEFLPNGSLQNLLSSADDKNSFLGWDKLQEIALGIAKGIEYLHQGCDQRILHFDIKPHNILLDQNFTPKVSDFGLAKLCSKDQSAISMTTARGTMGYIAPEVFSRNFGNVSYKSDVYSFGTLLLEMVGGRKNFKIMEDSTREVYFPEWIYNLLEQGNDLRIHMEDEGDAELARKLAIVGLWCMQWHPIDRPPMKVVVQMLESECENLTMPPNPFASTSN